MQTVFLVRCQAFDAMARNVALSLSDAGADVVVVVDERKALADTAPFPKISLNDTELAALGLLDMPPDWGWLCGDVCYYAARRHMPEVTHFCLVESDVAFSANAATLFVQAVQKDPSDLLAAALGPRETAPKYSRGLQALGYDPQMGCYFPVTRCSAPAIDWMHDLRCRSVAAGVAPLINDEAILCAATQTGSFAAHSLNDLLPDLFTPRTFATNPPHLAEAVHRYTARANVYHPAIPLDVVLDRIATGDRGYSRHRMRQVLKGATADESARITRALDVATADVPRFAVLARALGLHDPITVLDVGANPLIEGTAPYVPLLRAGLASVFGFEPQAAALDALNAQKSEAETYFPDAVGDGTPAKLNLYAAQGFTSLYPIDEHSARYLGFGKGANLAGTVDLVTSRLDDIAEIPPVDLLKIDVQGAETQIIAHGRAKLAQALVIITEMRMFPIYQDEPRFGDLAAELHAQGFEFLRFASLKHVALSRRHRGSLRRSEFAQAVDGDAIFVRDLRNMTAFDDDSLKKLAVIADAVIDNADLVVSVLELLEDRGAIPATVIPDYLARLPAGKRR
ncbi:MULTISPECIES: FkbM family methyltransferase [unclassified Yoonia]|uniref:FkbM family methyltransferase n=1 Tax=unclassified Yoonia TaxID=2629118 RepID=UPI002AFDECC4|nr:MULTISPECIES: FkbM family methyltransferase [unclassified Yoonia]